MAHACEVCGLECYCDMDDTGGFEQPDDCVHLTNPDECGVGEGGDFDDDKWGGWDDDLGDAADEDDL